MSYFLSYYNGFAFYKDFFVTHGLGPVKPDPRAAKPITPLYIKNSYRIEVKIMLIAYLVLPCAFF